MIKRVLLFVLTSLCAAPVLAGTLDVLYYPAANEALREIRQQLQKEERLGNALTVIESEILGEQDLKVLFGVGDGPLYDPASQSVFMPYEFVAQISDFMDQADYATESTERQQVIMDVVVHTLLHETGHALIDQYALPVVGRQEDAVDSFAVVVLLDYFADGANAAISAADFFAIEDWVNNDQSEAQFWGDHSLDIQRSNRTLCHVYGSSPDDYPDLLDLPGVDTDVREICIEDYSIVRESWKVLLDSVKQMQTAS